MHCFVQQSSMCQTLASVNTPIIYLPPAMQFLYILHIAVSYSLTYSFCWFVNDRHGLEPG